tara:strand:- start:228 stop:995 length:768 start_codon:yes stop_codon:yes gene_type:complete
MSQPPLNSLQSMFNLGNTPKINNNQMTLNLRFIDQDNQNAIDRNRLRRSFGNFVYRTKKEVIGTSVSINITPGLLSRTAKITKQEDIYAYNRATLTIIFELNTAIVFGPTEIQYDTTTLSDSSEFASFSLDTTRKIITYTNTNHIPNLGGLTPFRKAYNAGDIMNKYNKPPTNKLINRPPNQINSINNMFGWQSGAGSVNTKSDGSFYSGNPKFVYDGSDYSRFKKLQAINRNYNDTTFGGDKHLASQQAYRKVH